MTQLSKPFLTLLAALTLTACQPAPPPPPPINLDSDASFGIHAVLQDESGGPASQLPDGYVLNETAQRLKDRNGERLYIALPAVIDKTCLKSIQAAEVEYGGPVLNFALTPDCAKRFGEFTAKQVGNRMALMLNGELVTAPHIRTAITGGSGFIEGGFANLEEAEAIARQFY